MKDVSLKTIRKLDLKVPDAQRIEKVPSACLIYSIKRAGKQGYFPLYSVCTHPSPGV